MKPELTVGGLIFKGLVHYWRTNVAVVIGVATAVAVLTGALLVGDSVRGSLRAMVLQRLGMTDQVIVSSGYFREQLAQELKVDGNCPIIITRGIASIQGGSGRVREVRVYGVDDRFWKFHGLGVSGPSSREALISSALARELGTQADATVLVRVQRPTDIPLESLHSHKEDLGRTIRATIRDVLPAESLGEFSLMPQQGEVLAVFLSLARLQQELEIAGRVNAILVSGTTDKAALEQLVRNTAQLEDLGLHLKKLENRQAFALEADGGLIDEAKASAAIQELNATHLRVQPIFTYVANSLKSGDRETPYSLVTAMDLPEIAPDPGATGPPPVLLNQWAARDLKVAVGAVITMDYYVWEDPGRLATRTSEFKVAGIAPIDDRDRDLAPVYPGITESTSLSNWDPPFPIDLRKIRPVDEEYWKAHRTVPKAMIHFAMGYPLWRSRYGAATSIRLTPEPGTPLESAMDEARRRLRSKMNPLAMGIAVQDVRAESLEASKGATNFGEYFVYFSFFLVVSALLLAALFFKLSVEQRGSEIGLLRAVGFGPREVMRVFVGEALILSIAGAVAGVVAGIGYASLLVAGLRSWWIGAVGTTSIGLHVSPLSVAGGAIGGILAALLCIWATLRGLARISERQLLSGQLAQVDTSGTSRGGKVGFVALGLGVIGIALIAAAAAGMIDESPAFFGGASLLLAASLCLFAAQFAKPARGVIEGRGWWPVSRLGLRNVTHRPARSVLSIAMIAAATFILISVDAFRKDGSISGDRNGGTGGYSLLVESLLPIVQDPGSREGRAALGLSESDQVTIEPFRVRPGDDASCLNLYQPRNPKILAPGLTFIAEGRFAFQDSLASNEGEEKDPWLLLLRNETDGAIPVIADANSMTYVLHRKLGEDIVMTVGDRAVRLRLVAALRDSIFQGELLMSQPNFLKLFPEQEGYQALLIEAPAGRTAAIASAVENALADFGAVVVSPAERLAQFHRVENTYLSTFQMLGGLGLLLGTVGLGAVLLRNVFERRRELALLRALGYKEPQIFTMVIAENVFLLVSGLLTGTLSALLAMMPALLERGGRLPGVSLALLLAAVLLTGLVTSLIATASALRSPLLAALRSE